MKGVGKWTVSMLLAVAISATAAPASAFSSGGLRRLWKAFVEVLEGGSKRAARRRPFKPPHPRTPTHPNGRNWGRGMSSAHDPFEKYGLSRPPDSPRWPNPLFRNEAASDYVSPGAPAIKANSQAPSQHRVEIPSKPLARYKHFDKEIRKTKRQSPLSKRLPKLMEEREAAHRLLKSEKLDHDVSIVDFINNNRRFGRAYQRFPNDTELRIIKANRDALQKAQVNHRSELLAAMLGPERVIIVMGHTSSPGVLGGYGRIETIARQCRWNRKICVVLSCNSHTWTADSDAVGIATSFRISKFPELVQAVAEAKPRSVKDVEAALIRLSEQEYGGRLMRVDTLGDKVERGVLYIGAGVIPVGVATWALWPDDEAGAK